MGPTYAAVLMLLGVICKETLGNTVTAHFEPMVAFMCNKPAMYLTKEKGWLRDETTDCLKKPADILNYCKKRFDSDDITITNVVEANHEVEIDNWCHYGKKHCKHGKYKMHTVRPYRCLVGAFQSDALLVPEHCMFDHIHNSECKTEREWNKTAVAKCATTKNMKLKSFAMLLPCGIEHFSGVEFVCCPSEKTKPVPVLQAPKKHKHHDKKPKEHKQEQHKPAHVAEHHKQKTEEKPKIDDYQEYLHSANLGHFLNEHQHFKAAEKTWLHHHREKITKMMKEWAAARKHVQEMRSTDPKSAQKLNKEITSRFQKTYQALEEEGLAEKKQLVSVHQNRVQKELNDKKRDAMEKFMEALTVSKPKAANILKRLKQYLKAEQKDRMHAVNHYKHMIDSYPEYASKIRTQTIEHIKIIEQRMNQSLTMLKRVPQFEAKIKHQIEQFLKSFHDVDVSIVNILLKPVHNVEKVTTKHKEVHHYGHKAHDKPVHPPTYSKDKLHKVPLHKAAIKVHAFDDETDEDETIRHGPILTLKKSDSVGHASASKLSAETQEFQHRAHSEVAFQAGGTLGIAVGCIAVFVIIVVAVVVLRKKAQKVPLNHAYVDVDHAVSPEERHVTNMQINGYENPTYKYFETPTTTAST